MCCAVLCCAALRRGLICAACAACLDLDSPTGALLHALHSPLAPLLRVSLVRAFVHRTSVCSPSYTYTPACIYPCCSFWLSVLSFALSCGPSLPLFVLFCCSLLVKTKYFFACSSRRAERSLPLNFGGQYWRVALWAHVHTCLITCRCFRGYVCQAKMVKTFDNYSFARDAWSLLVAPAWYPGVVRIGALSLVKGDGGKQSSSSPAPQQIPAPVRPGALVYAQQVGIGLF